VAEWLMLLPLKETNRGSIPFECTKNLKMETLKEIVNGTMAKLSHICNGKVYFRIETSEHVYQLEIDCDCDEWKDVYMYPEYKAITLMRWIRKGMDNKDDTFIMLK
jgi:hypothetical protein